MLKEHSHAAFSIDGDNPPSTRMHLRFAAFPFRGGMMNDNTPPHWSERRQLRKLVFNYVKNRSLGCLIWTFVKRHFQEIQGSFAAVKPHAPRCPPPPYFTAIFDKSKSFRCAA